MSDIVDKVIGKPSRRSEISRAIGLGGRGAAIG
jgi:hypothetical protein